MTWNRKIFKSLCETCKKHCGGHFDIATVYQCDDWIKKENKMKKIKIDGKWIIEHTPHTYYVKKPIPIRAVQYNSSPFEVVSMEGKVKGKAGDYIVEGIKGEIYICDRVIFEESYQEVRKDK